MRAYVFAIVAALTLAGQVARPACVRTDNFQVCAPTGDIAQQVAAAAEADRRELAEIFAGSPLPGTWWHPARVRVVDAQSAGGSTSFAFDGGVVFGWDGTWRGRGDALTDGVVPHEVAHMVLASHFGRPVPRWCDEGLACLVEGAAGDRGNWRREMEQLATSPRRIPLARLVTLEDYPRDFRAFYAQSHSVCEYLADRFGPEAPVAIVAAYFDGGDWNEAFRTVCGVGLADTERAWLAWVQGGQVYRTAYCGYCRGRGWLGRIGRAIAGARARRQQQTTPGSPWRPSTGAPLPTAPAPGRLVPVQPVQPVQPVPPSITSTPAPPTSTSITTPQGPPAPVTAPAAPTTKDPPAAPTTKDPPAAEIDTGVDDRGGGVGGWLLGMLPGVLAALGWTAPPSIAGLLAVRVLAGVIRRRRRRTATVGQGASTTASISDRGSVATGTPVVIHDDQKPAPQVVVRDREFVEVQVPADRLKALEMAMDEYVRRYPAARSMIETIEGYADQFQSGFAKTRKET